MAFQPSKLPIAATEPIPPVEKVEAWSASQVSHVADVLSATSISSPQSARTVTLDIPLNDPGSVGAEAPREKQEAVHTVYKRRAPIRRDSLNRREALLKGKEGSRRRQRWENDRLLSNPHAEPPLPSDWEVRPTYPVQSVPYFLAPLWDARYAREAADRHQRSVAAEKPVSKEEAAAQRVKQELRAKLKKSRGAKGLLQDLEEEVRGFVVRWEEKARQLEKEGLIETSDSEDEEIVFVGRNGSMSDERRKQKDELELEKDKLIFKSLVDDHGASFGYALLSTACKHVCMTDLSRRRYLVHSIAQYYGLKTWSITTGDPARREAYVGLKTDPKTRRPSLTRSEMPRPLYALV